MLQKYIGIALTINPFNLSKQRQLFQFSQKKSDTNLYIHSYSFNSFIQIIEDQRQNMKDKKRINDSFNCLGQHRML